MGLSPFSWSSHPGPWLSVPALSHDYHMLLWFPHSYNQLLAIFSRNCMSKIQFLTSVFAQNMVPQTIFPIPGNSNSCHVKMFDSPDPLPFILSYLRSWVFTLAWEFLYDLISSASVNNLWLLSSLLHLFQLFCSWFEHPGMVQPQGHCIYSAGLSCADNL